jgi:hypothetical protein
MTERTERELRAQGKQRHEGHECMAKKAQP